MLPVGFSPLSSFSSTFSAKPIHASYPDCSHLLPYAPQAQLKAEILRGRLDLLATQVLGLQLQPFQERMLRFCYEQYQRQGEGLLLAPRGFGKSCLATVCFALWLILHNRNIRILIVSSTSTKAESFVREIKTHLQCNAVLRKLFGDLMDASCWRQGEISVRGRTRSSKESTVTARGCSGAVVGLHFDVHLIDDLVNEDNARTKRQRDKLKDWVYMSLDPTLQPHGCRMLTGTRYHPNDFYNHLVGLSAQKPITSKSPSKPGSLGLLRLRALGKGERSLWPAKFSVEWLRRKRERMGSIRFNAQYQNDCSLMQGKVFRQGDIRYYDRASVDMSRLTIVQGVDLAIGQGQHHDYFALVTKGYDAQGRGYTLDVVKGRYSFQQQLMVILYKAGYSVQEIGQTLGMTCYQREIDRLFATQPAAARTQYGDAGLGQSAQGLSDPDTYHQTQRSSSCKSPPPSISLNGMNSKRTVCVNSGHTQCVGVEGVAYQKVLGQYLLERAPGLPLVCVPQRVDKRTRMTIYAARFENHREFFPADNSCDALLEEVLLFPDGQHDDVLDAHEIGHRVALPLLQGAQPFADTQVRVFV